MSDTAPQPVNLVLGTAGHIDHGKSSLVRALTGTDPDRLAEEKRRGITIELGFAQLVLPSGRAFGVVDVPGHERFVRHMVAGATGVDVALVVIAADDGIMPQTVEHLAVLELLGVRTAVVALTKIDLVDDEWRAFITDEVASRLQRGPFAGAPIVGVSSRTGEGLPALLEALEAAAERAERTKEAGGMRMPVDRVFSVRGFGTVVTGTLWSGEVAEGDALVTLPARHETRVRSVQMHGRPCDKALAGNRVALSLAGLSTEDVRPGDFLCAPSCATLSDRFDAEFTYLDPFTRARPLASGVRVHVAHGTREVIGRVLLMDDTDALQPGEKAFAQIRLEEPLAVAYRDRFIVRSYSPVHVIGGGTVLTPHPRRRTTLKPEEQRMLTALDEGDVTRAVGAHLELAALPETQAEIARACGLDEPLVRDALALMADEARVCTLDARTPLFARPALLQKLIATIERTLLSFHLDNPQATGVSKEALRQMALPAADAMRFDALIEEAIRRKAITSTGGEISHPQASQGARKATQAAADKLAEALRAADATPPDLADIIQKMKIDPAVARKAATQLLRDGRAVRVDDTRYYDAAVIERYKAAVTQRIQTGGPATAAELKEAMGTTRKYAMPLLEYFDSIGFTRRDGDVRTLV